MNDSMIEQTATRLFGDHVNRALLERFEEGHKPERLWQLVVENGLDLALAPQAAGGIGASWNEAYPILRALGYHQVPLPLAETMIAALLLGKAGIEIPAGPIALIDEGRDNSIQYSGAAGAAVLDGSARRVAWAGECRWAVAALNDGDICLVDIGEGPTVQVTRQRNQAREPQDDLRFEGTRIAARAANPFPALDAPLRSFGALAKSAMMVGAMEWVLEQSTQYAMDRVQFGRAIGKNQAIQQSLALLAGEVACARAAALVAASDSPSMLTDDCAAALFSIAVAKIRVGEAATRATAIAHQVHGAIGFTYEHGLNYATRRLWAWREACGADAFWAEQLGRAAIAARAGGFWPAVTQRHFGGQALRAPR